MTYAIALLCAILATIANGSAVILEKIGVDQQPRRLKLSNGLMKRLIGNRMYILGIGLDIVGWLLTLVSLKALPLYLVQSIIASNIIVTALLDQLVLKRSMPRSGYRLIAVILVALCCLAITAPAQTVAHAYTGIYFWAGLVLLAFVSLAGFGALYLPGRKSAVALAASAGVAFGGVSIAARLLVSHVSLLGFLEQPLTYVLIAGSLIGTVWFTVALRRSSATMVNAITLSVQTVAPASLGIILLGDKVRDGYLPLMITSLAIALVGSLSLGAVHNTHVTRKGAPAK